MSKKAIKIAEEAMEVMKKKSKIYENDYKDMINIRIMMILYPNGVPNKYHELVRYRYVLYMVDKIFRYMVNKRKDNLLDLANYAFMLAAQDEENEE
jgi:hypothetical protein